MGGGPCCTTQWPGAMLNIGLDQLIRQTHRKRSANSELIALFYIYVEGHHRHEDRRDGAEQGETYRVEPRWGNEIRGRTDGFEFSLPLTIHCNSTARASSTRLTHLSSQAKNLTNLIAEISSLSTPIRLSRAVEVPLAIRLVRFAMMSFRGKVRMMTINPANAAQPSNLSGMSGFERCSAGESHL